MIFIIFFKSFRVRRKNSVKKTIKNQLRLFVKHVLRAFSFVKVFTTQHCIRIKKKTPYVLNKHMLIYVTNTANNVMLHQNINCYYNRLHGKRA